MNVPKLRFKDDDGRPFSEWESNLLGSYAEAISSGKSNARNGNGRYILYGSTGSIGYADDYDYQGEKLLIARVGANAGYLYRVEGDYCVSDNTLMLTLKQPHNYSFFFNLLTKKNLNKLVFGSGQPLITGGHLKNLEVSVPSLPEQTKIANFLTAVDEKIQLLIQKSDLLNQYKKGVMQKIFSQELRFKDDDEREFPEWEEVVLDDILDYEQPTKYLVSSVEYDDSYEIPVLTAGKTFILGYTNETTGVFQQNLPVIIFDDFTTAFKYVNFPFKAKSSAMKILKIKDTTNSIKYVYEAMQLIDFPSGDEHKRYWISEYSKISIPLPSLGEQTKIANFLTAIDDKITQTKSELDAVKQYKQGLLQQMFV